MALRASWEGFLKLSLISLPVRAYNAASAGAGEIHFHQIHRECGNRIRYQKVCPIHGEITKEEIVSGYEYEKNHYAEVEPDEIASVKAEKDQSINIDAFIPLEALDPIYLSGKTFYLVPDGPAGQKAFTLLHQIMEERSCQAVAGIVLNGHEETVVIRPHGKLLIMMVLYYEHQIKTPAALEQDLGDEKISAKELKLAGSLVEASTTDKVDFSHYKDKYTERVRQVIDAKLAGKKVKALPAEKPRAVINLMDALQESLKKKTAGKTTAAKRQPQERRRPNAKRKVTA